MIDLFGNPFSGIPIAQIAPTSQWGERKQFRFPRTKNRRIQKKWRKRAENWRWVAYDNVIKTPQGLVMSQLQYDRIMDMADRTNYYRKI